MNSLRNEEAESAVLGSMLLDDTKRAINKAREVLTADDFEIHKGIIFNTICQMSDNNENVDIVTLLDKFKRDNFINAAYITNIINTVPTAANIDYYIDIVKTCSIRRRGILLLDERKKQLLESEHPEEVISSGMIADMRLIKNDSRSKVRHIKDIVSETYFNIDNRRDKDFLGIPTGINIFDKLTGGIIEDCLTIIAGRPGTGKTTFMEQIALNLANNHPGMFASLEMSGERLIIKMIANETGINSRCIDIPKKLNEYEWGKLSTAVNNLSSRTLYIDDSTEMKASQIAVRARMLKYDFDLKYLIVDYLQIVHPEDGKKYTNRRDEINDSLRIFKSLARELKINVILLSQILRDVEKRERKKPTLADLKETGAIEEMGDIIAFIYRDDKSVEKTERIGKEDWIVTSVNIAKNKYGPADCTFDLIFRKDISKFFEMESNYAQV